MLAVFAAVMRRNLHETEAFVEAKKLAKPTGSIRGLLKYPRELLLVSASRRRHRGVLHLHDLHADLRQIVGRADRGSDHYVIFGSLIFATLLSRFTARCPTASAANRC